MNWSTLIYSFDLMVSYQRSRNFRMHFTFGLFLSRKFILISHCSGGQQDLNPVFNDKISCAYTLDATLVIEYSLCGGTISPRFTPESFLATLTSDSWLLLTQRNIYFVHQVVWVIRNSDSSQNYVLGGSEIRNPVPCVGDQKFRGLSCVLWGIRISESFTVFL